MKSIFDLNVYVLICILQCVVLTANQPVLCDVSCMLVHGDVTHFDLDKKDISKSENARKFLQKCRKFEYINLEDLPLIVDYINIIFMRTIQFALENTKIPNDIIDTKKLVLMLPKIESLNYTEEDLVKIASVVDEYQQSIAMKKQIGHISRNAYDQLCVIFANAIKKDKKEFISEYLKNKPIAKVVAYGLVSLV